MPAAVAASPVSAASVASAGHNVSFGRPAQGGWSAQGSFSSQQDCMAAGSAQNTVHGDWYCSNFSNINGSWTLYVNLDSTPGSGG